METITPTGAKAAVEELAADLKLTIKADFVPFSMSRNAKYKFPSLNWKVTLLCDGKLVYGPFDYMAGSAHCPSYKQNDNYETRKLVAAECQHGRKAFYLASVDIVNTTNGKPILPDLASVLSSLAMDADVIDYGNFEQWAGDLGYEADSRKAEGIYRECLQTALSLRSALGDANMSKLRDLTREM